MSMPYWGGTRFVAYGFLWAEIVFDQRRDGFEIVPVAVKLLEVLQPFKLSEDIFPAELGRF